jgi:hypothetical protein
MPRLRGPRPLGSHKLACTALYRAFLRQCGDLEHTLRSGDKPFPSSTLQGLIGYRFRRDRKLRSLERIRDAFRQAHTYLDLLHQVGKGNQLALKEVIGILQATFKDANAAAAERVAQTAQHPSPRFTNKALHTLLQKSKRQHEPPEDSVGLVNHPIPLASLKNPTRTVPHFINSQKNIPFLRYSKPLPVHLGRNVRQRMKWFEWAHIKAQSLEEDINLGKVEDEWDDIIHEQMVKEFGRKFTAVKDLSEDRGLTWFSAPKSQHTELYTEIRRKGNLNSVLGARMWDITKQERRLKNWEDLPDRVIQLLRRVREIEVRLSRWTKRVGTKYRFPLQDPRIYITHRVECKAMGHFHIPVEWAVRAEHKSVVYWRELERKFSDVMAPWETLPASAREGGNMGWEPGAPVQISVAAKSLGSAKQGNGSESRVTRRKAGQACRPGARSFRNGSEPFYF